MREKERGRKSQEGHLGKGKNAAKGKGRGKRGEKPLTSKIVMLKNSITVVSYRSKEIQSVGSWKKIPRGMALGTVTAKV